MNDETQIFKNLPVIEFADVGEWQFWLDRNHASLTGIWLKFAKKGSGHVTVTYEEARNMAIAYGWIDGLINKFDEHYYLTRFTPRKPNSNWSKVNCEVVDALIANGEMHPAGLVHVEAAKRDGRWERSYDSPSNMAMSDDFQMALDTVPQAAKFFATLNAANRYSFLYRIQTAKPEKRAAKIVLLVKMLAEEKCFHPEA